MEPHLVPSPTWSPPSQIDEFQLDRKLGSGASGDVWLARDTLLERPVALKIASEAVDDEVRARFRMEARAIARLQHPNVLAVHHAGEVDAHPYLVTELLSGKSLDGIALPLDPARVVAVGIDLARGLSAAHRAGVIHRDIKPANAFLGDDGVAKLIDFGLAKLNDTPGELAVTSRTELSAPPSAALDSTQPDHTYSGRLAGTPLYMAPETWRGEAPTRRTDIYSLGALLFELLAAAPPVTAKRIDELRSRVLTGAHEDLGSHAPSAPAALVALVARCLSVNPKDRPTADDVCDGLEQLAAPTVADDEAEDPETNPYRGLLVFGPEHRALFFGREAETATVLAELRAHPFVLVVGPSGTGKSSLIRAGVVPRVEAGALGSGGARRALVIVPGRRPLESLAQGAARALGMDEEWVTSNLATDPEWLAQEVRAKGARLLLVVDQLEETWTLASAEDRTAFFEVLAALVEVGRTTRVVATLRADFLPRLEDLGPLQQEALRAPVALGPLTPKGVLAAIVEPSRRRGVTLEPALVEHIVTAAAGGSLPLLEFALAALWDRRDTATKTLGSAALRDLGGVEGALAAHADDALARMPPAERDEARRILLRLVTVEGTRARREEAELRSSKEGGAALEALVETRLVVASAGDLGTAYEIAHEALLSGWPTLGGWLGAETAAREAADRVERAAAEWERLGRSNEALFGEALLDKLGVLGERKLAPREEAFVDVSRAAVRGSRRRRLAVWIGAPVLLAVIGATAWVGAVARDRAAVGRATDEARTLDATAEETARAADDLRARALSLFEKDDLVPAEAVWAQALGAEAKADAQRRDVSAALDRALALDPTSDAARGLYADVTFARLLAAERLHDDALLGSLRARLASYDDGSHLDQLGAKGHVRATTEPSAAALTLARYREDASGHLVESDAAPFVTGVSHDLEPGSYVLHAALGERYPSVFPFVVGRGESRALRVVLPPARSVPEEMVYVPAGRSEYGSGDGEAARAFLTHQPIHDVEVGAFLVARTEVTYADYLAYLRALPEAPRSVHTPDNVTFGRDGLATVKIRDVSVREGDPYCLPGRPCVPLARLPVNFVSQDDAAAYASWLSSSGRLVGARLCTDREWERAARGADDRRFPNGNADLAADDACTLTTYGGNRRRAGPCGAGSHPTSRSPFGLDDATGNVWEWTASTPDIAQPQTGVLRGASWTDDGLYLVLSNRGVGSHSEHVRLDGFRVCARAP